MRKLMAIFIAFASFFVTLEPAMAQYRRHGYYGSYRHPGYARGYYRGYRGHYYHRRSNAGAAVAAGVALGVVAGAAIVANENARYRNPAKYRRNVRKQQEIQRARENNYRSDR